MAASLLARYTARVKPAIKSILSLAIGGAALSVLSLVLWIWVNSSINGLAYGHVVRVTPGYIEVADRREGVTTVHIDTGTLILNESVAVPLTDVPIGQFVQVRGTRMDRRTVRADSIIFLRSPRRAMPHDDRS